MTDETFMRRALALARRGRGRTSPNPMVGAVVVSEGEIVGEGWHLGPGTPHAEAMAIKVAGKGARGATLYVTLEPCAHHGRTPPCTDVVASCGLRRVFAAVADPDPRTSGRGIGAMTAAGIKIEVGLLGDEARRQNAEYFVHRLLGRPYVTYKAAITIDGRTSAADGSSRWITGPEARRDSHRLRALTDAICVGIGTVAADDPDLTVREVRSYRRPLRVVVDSGAVIPLESRVLSKEAPTLLAVAPEAPSRNLNALRDAGVEILPVPVEDGRLSLGKMLQLLADRGVVSMLLEGGGKLAGSFAAAGLIDRYVFYISPKLIGGKGRSPLESLFSETIDDARQLRIESVRRLGEDLRVTAYPEEAAE